LGSEGGRDIDFKVISVAETSNKFQKITLKKKERKKKRDRRTSTLLYPVALISLR
jgi:hypothetical protein